jgi:hypothetical protein
MSACVHNAHGKNFNIANALKLLTPLGLHEAFDDDGDDDDDDDDDEKG